MSNLAEVVNQNVMGEFVRKITCLTAWGVQRISHDDFGPIDLTLRSSGSTCRRKRFHKIKGTDLWELRSRWQHRIARSLFFEAGGRLLVVTAIFQKKTEAIPKAPLKRALDRMEKWKKGRS
jgi:phage-related protein